MDNAPAPCSARVTPDHRLSPLGLVTLHAVATARQSGVALRDQLDVWHGGHVDLGDASDRRDDLGPAAFELVCRCLHVDVPDYEDGVFRWGIAAWHEPKGIQLRGADVRHLA